MIALWEFLGWGVDELLFEVKMYVECEMEKPPG